MEALSSRRTVRGQLDGVCRTTAIGMPDSDLKLGNLVEALAESVAGELEGSTSKDDIAEALKFEPDKAWYCPEED